MSNYIFPPIVDTYQKAFVIGGESIAIKYQSPPIQEYNEKEKYTKKIDVTIRNQYNNLSVLKNGDTEYTIELLNGETGEIGIPQNKVNIGLNQWYRVQLRYCIMDKDTKTISYSEWSTVTLIKAISAPTITLGAPFVKDPENPSNPITVNSQSVAVQGSIQFGNKNDDETLQSYEIELLRGGAIIEKSGLLYPDPFNARAIGPYQLKSTLQFLNDASYTLNIKYTTKGFYTNEYPVEFTYSKGTPKALLGDFFVTANHNKGYNEIQVGLYEEDYIQRNHEGKEIGGNKVFKIQRSSYRNNHTTRETLFTIDLTKYNGQYPTVPLRDPYAETDAQDTLFEHPASASANIKTYDFSQVFADTTAEPGILYRYYLVDAEGTDYDYRSGYSKNLCSETALKMTANGGVIRKLGSCKYDYAEKKITLTADANDNSAGIFGMPFSPKPEKNYTFSCEIKGTSGKKVQLGWLWSRKTVTLTTEYQKVTHSMSGSQILGTSGFCLYSAKTSEGGLASGEYLQFKNVQIEEGSPEKIVYEPYISSTYLECMLDVEHIFFTDINSQFRLNLNPNISSFKYVVQESVTNTLGSAFPFVRRSGHTKYRQFSISGTICGYGDDEGIFLSRNSASLILSQGFYDRYKAQNRIMSWNDYIFEKQYRDKAIEFLMDGKPKLFKSFTEGNMIVALTAVSFTPNKQLDRNVYDFSATVTEIAECTVENCQKYNCYENEAYKMFAPTEYYLVAEWTEQVNDMIAAIQANNPYMNYAGQGYLCVHEVTSMLQAYNPSSELDEILANDSVIRRSTT